MCQSKRQFLKPADKINRGHSGEDMTHTRTSIHKEKGKDGFIDFKFYGQDS